MCSIRCSSRNLRTCRELRKSQSGFTLIQVVVAAAVVCICGVAGIQSLIFLNQKAASARLMTSAREIVERNINAALSVPYTTSSVPAILATTAAAGSTYEDDGGSDGYVAVAFRSDGTTSFIKGTLTRTVVAEPNTVSATILRVTFGLTFTYRNRNYSYSMTTLRTTDS
jgi:type II secretory pathway pseudopilin PulG